MNVKEIEKVLRHKPGLVYQAVLKLLNEELKKGTFTKKLKHSSVNSDKRDVLKLLALIGGTSVLGALTLSNAESIELLNARTQKVHIETRSFVIPASYIIFGEDTNGDGIVDVVYARNGKTGEIEFRGTDAVTVMQKARDMMPEGATMFIKAGRYLMTAKLTSNKEIFLKGEGRGTKLIPTGNFDAIDTTNIRVMDLVWRDSSGVDHDASFDPNMFGEILREELDSKLRSPNDEVFVKDLSVGTDPIQVDADTKVRAEITLLADDGNTDVIYVGNSANQLFPLVAGASLTLRNCSLSKIYVKAASGTQVLHVIAGGW
ncbi:MAG: hypothetical protein ACXQS5_04680 [Candidatus Methanospirareceae archaeon]